jgi:HEAT repeat protein
MQKSWSGTIIAAWLMGGLFACCEHPVAAQPPAEAESSSAAASSAAPAPPAGDDENSIQAILERLNRVERELDRLRAEKGQVPADRQDQKVVTVIEHMHLGMSYYGTGGVRYFAAHLIFVNLTPDEVTIERGDIELAADGKLLPLQDVPPQLQGRAFQIGNQSYQMRNLNPVKQLKLPAGGTGSTWVVFSDLPTGNHVPKLVLKTNIAGKVRELDVNEFALGLLGLTVERIGPHKSLTLMTIDGALNSVNIGSLLDELDRMAEQKRTRAVITWSDSGAVVEPQVRSWLQQMSAQAGRDQAANNATPVVPATIRELHLAQLPNPGSHSAPYSYSSPPSSGGAAQIHNTTGAAVMAALQSAYEVLPRDELLIEIQTGSPLTRAAALAGGGGRLDSAHLPLLLKHADDDDPDIQRGALVALRHFGEQSALDTLLHFTRKNAEPTATVATESLAGSRYAAAHQALLSILESEPPASKKAIVQVLARYPRPIWSDAIYEFVNDADEELAIEALRALVQIGHPKLMDVLQAALERGNAARQAEAFNILVARADVQSEEMAMNYTLKHMETSLPTAPMYNLLSRTKDQRAVALLLRHFEQSKANRSSIVNTLAQIGDETVSQALVEQYPKMDNSDKTAVLKALVQLKSPAARKLAGEALLTSDNSLISAACQALQADGSAEAVQLLSDGLERASSSTAWNSICNALGALGTPDAKTALMKARDSGNAGKKSFANNALRSLRQRSPGYQYVYQGQHYARQEQWQQSIDRYTLALEIDSQLPEAYAGRANVYLKQNKLEEARTDYVKALELEPEDSQSVTGLAIVMVLEEKYEAGIEFVEDKREAFANDMIFAYNTACVYGRALEYVQKDKDVPDRERKLADYKQKALADLERSVKMGFRDFEWMQKDPDLNSLHEFPEFRKIHSPDGGAPPAGEAAPAPPINVDVR